MCCPSCDTVNHKVDTHKKIREVHTETHTHWERERDENSSYYCHKLKIQSTGHTETQTEEKVYDAAASGESHEPTAALRVEF